MHFIVFSAVDKAGNRIADPMVKGAFSVKMHNKEFKWKLPLSSLLPAQTCGKCKERLKGNWSFCPYDGAKLPNAGKY